MKNPFYIIILLVLLSVYACDKSGKCSDFIDLGYSIADGSYETIEANAVFGVVRVKDKTNLSISFSNTTEDCFNNSRLSSFNLLKKIKDTIHLLKATSLSVKDYPSAIYYILDGDATPVEEYILLDTVDSNNWIIIESINADSTEIQGTFNMSFVTKNEKIISGERERWDDPNRPDTLHFTNGEFLAVRNN